ncbi:MAG: ArsR/SmtB family transcription factor, partial [Hyphomicrobiaceae bacterium]
MLSKYDAESGLTALRAVAEATRLRVLFLLMQCELTVKDLTKILGQSQPRISRHLKLLHQAGLIERHREGSWVYFRLADSGFGAGLAGHVLSTFDEADPIFSRDRDRLATLLKARAAAAQAYFERNAADWDRLRSLYVDEAVVEEAMRNAVGSELSAFMVDLGTGTGRMLELFSDTYKKGLGIDANKAMLSYARAKLDQLTHAGVQVREGDIYHLPIEDDAADLVLMHQVLHYLQDPQSALIEAGRILGAEGRLLVADFAPHDLDFLREEFAHERLGFSDGQMRQWMHEAGLEVTRHESLESEQTTGSGQLTVSLWIAAKSDKAPLNTNRTGS